MKILGAIIKGAGSQILEGSAQGGLMEQSRKKTRLRRGYML